MTDDTLPTQSAKAERSTPEELQQQRAQVLHVSNLRRLMDAVPDLVAILNQHRQVVFANRALTAFLRCPADEVALGLRPGEAVKCGHSDSSPGGCGTDEHCEMCGAANAILTAQKGIADIRECCILRKNGDALDLRVWATPFEHGDGQFTFFVAQDRSSETRRRALERIFFHDVLNTLGGLYGYADMLNDQIPESDEAHAFSQTVFQLSSDVIDEIKAQKDLSAAENLELKPHFEETDALEVLCDVMGTYRAHEVARDKHIEVSPESMSISLRTDKIMARRIVGNLVKNALEASKADDTVTVGCTGDGDHVSVTVHNAAVMPRKVQLQVFQRSYSTKGKGRGLGTYSVKLLTERYLGGEAFFVSTEEDGTTFTVRLPREPPPQ